MIKLRTARGGPIKKSDLMWYILRRYTILRHSLRYMCFLSPLGSKVLRKICLAFDVSLMGHGEMQVSMLPHLNSEYNNFHLFSNLRYTIQMLHN